MKSNLNFSKEGDKIILRDESVYETLEDVQQLYNTFKAMKLNADSQKERTEQTLERINQELEVLASRFNQVKEFLAAEGINVADDEVELRD